MTAIHTLAEIKQALARMDLTQAIAQGFIAYSKGEAVVGPVGELNFSDPPGDTHIKYGYLRKEENFVVKIASGFYQNPGLGLASSSGLMLVFSQKTGMLHTILLDEGYLTDLRTALAGQICARLLAPGTVHGIGVLGTGIQARMQVAHLKPVISCSKVFVWGRTRENALTYKTQMTKQGFEVTVMDSPAQVAEKANLIITATPSPTPLLSADQVRPGTHITAVGADAGGKQELTPELVARAGLIVADSLAQCRERGEIAHALACKAIKEDRIQELGVLLAKGPRVDRSPLSITLADLTGVAVQDIQIASAVCQALSKGTTA